MIEYRNTTVFNSNCEAIVNTVNCIGVMGAGLALEFSLRYPTMLEEYKKDCENKLVNIGKVNIYKDENQIILNFPTKYHWKFPSKIEWVEKGLEFIVQNYKKWNVKSIAIPPLGCSNGGLNFEKEVKPLIEKMLSNLDVLVVVCIDPGYPEGKEKEMLESFKKDDLEKICFSLKITGKAKEGLILNQALVNRFYEIKEIPGVGIKSYEKIYSMYIYVESSIYVNKASHLVVSYYDMNYGMIMKTKMNIDRVDTGGHIIQKGEVLKVYVGEKKSKIHYIAVKKD